MIKVNKLFSLLSSWYFLKEIINMFSVFLLNYRNTCESLGELEKKLWKHPLGARVPTAFTFTFSFSAAFSCPKKDILNVLHRS